MADDSEDDDQHRLMLRTLLSPISSRFPLSPRPDTIPATVQESDELSPEDFARDVLVEVMRGAVERLKLAEGLNTRTQVFIIQFPLRFYP